MSLKPFHSKQNIAIIDTNITEQKGFTPFLETSALAVKIEDLQVFVQVHQFLQAHWFHVLGLLYGHKPLFNSPSYRPPAIEFQWEVCSLLLKSTSSHIDQKKLLAKPLLGYEQAESDA